MKILKIENGNGHFRVSEGADWVEIDQIDKKRLMQLLNVFLSTDVEMDEMKEKNLHNQAQQIIYGKLAEKLKSLGENREKFKDESDRTYLDAIQKYSQV